LLLFYRAPFIIAAQVGIHKVLPVKYRKWRESCFSTTALNKQHAKQDDARAYGGLQMYQSYKGATQWKGLVEYMVQKGLVRPQGSEEEEEEPNCYTVNRGQGLPEDTKLLLLSWRLQEGTQQWFEIA